MPDLPLVERVLQRSPKWLPVKEISALIGRDTISTTQMLRRLQREQRAFEDGGVWGGPSMRPLRCRDPRAQVELERSTRMYRVLQFLVRLRQSPDGAKLGESYASAYRITSGLAEPGHEITATERRYVNQSLGWLIQHQLVKEQQPPPGTIGRRLVPVYRATDAGCALIAADEARS
jgi:hypothetical protein